MDSSPLDRNLGIGQIRCSNREREVDELTAIHERKTYWSDGCDELMPSCAECASREFGHAARRSS